MGDIGVENGLAGRFRGGIGVEQHIIDKVGAIEVRQVFQEGGR